MAAMQFYPRNEQSGEKRRRKKKKNIKKHQHSVGLPEKGDAKQGASVPLFRMLNPNISRTLQGPMTKIGKQSSQAEKHYFMPKPPVLEERKKERKTRKLANINLQFLFSANF
eukprot:TRINITY_DN3908_c0_g1_i3.p1 TRINITY_DN3908_c0_g1~~TRINITY_DN3908_c0_g1_i3.p1  ORF type:complete len:112 (-),score=11.17 TRINITY_DN3908_c0_g1_i3:1042-1377(-)